MSFQDLVSNIKETKNAAAASSQNVMAAIVAYSADKKVAVVKDAKTMELMAIEMANIKNNKQPKISELANNGNLNSTGLGGIVLFTGVKPNGEYEHNGTKIPKMVARWCTRQSYDGKDLSVMSDVAFNVKAGVRQDGKPFEVHTALLTSKARLVASAGELKDFVGKWFSQGLKNVNPAVTIRFLANDDQGNPVAVSDDIVISRPYKDGAALSGSDAIQAIVESPNQKLRDSFNRAINYADNENAQVEVVPGFSEFRSEKQIRQGNLLAVSKNDSGDDVFSPSAANYLKLFKGNCPYVGRVDGYLAGTAAIRGKEGENGVYHTIAALTPHVSGTGSVIGSVACLKTPNFEPGEHALSIIRGTVESVNALYNEAEHAHVEQPAQTQQQASPPQEQPSMPTDNDLPPAVESHDFDIDDFNFDAPSR